MSKSLTDIKKTSLAIALVATTTFVLSYKANSEDMPKKKAFKDNAYVTLTGKVEKIESEDKFKLKYRGGEILVDVDDGTPNLFGGNISKYLKVGDSLKVSGTYDENLLTRNELDAKTISLTNKDGSRTTYDYFNRDNLADKEDFSLFYVYDTVKIKEEQLEVSGFIKEIIDNDEFMLSYTSGVIKVDADNLKLLENDRFSVGDYVIVKGEFDKDLFQSSEIEADSITKVNYYYSTNL